MRLRTLRTDDPALIGNERGLHAIARPDLEHDARHVPLDGCFGQEQPAGNFRAIKLADWIAAHPLPTGGDAIGVITVAGEIVDGKAGPGTAGGDTVSGLLLKGLVEKKLKALVVRVDSPGGSVLASEQIRQAVLQAKAQGMPVVISMGSLAASGGYWVSTAGDMIFAEPNTITGSIGIFGIIPTFEDTLKKIGVTSDGVRTTPLSGQPDVIAGTNPTVATASCAICARVPCVASPIWSRC